MDYLTLCQKTWGACGLSGAGPVDVGKATSMHKRVVDWVDQAYVHIQQLHYNWSFLWAADLGALKTNQFKYAAAELGIAEFGWLIRIKLRDGPLRDPLAFCHVFDPFAFGAKSGKPAEFTVGPDSMWYFDLNPDQDYPVEFEYFRRPQHLVVNTDVPILPDDIQHLIIHRAKMYYALFDESNSDYADASNEYKSTLVRAEAKYLPSLEFSRSPF